MQLSLSLSVLVWLQLNAFLIKKEKKISNLFNNFSNFLLLRVKIKQLHHKIFFSCRIFFDAHGVKYVHIILFNYAQLILKHCTFLSYSSSYLIAFFR